MVTQTVRILALYLRTGEVSMAARVPLVYAHAAVLVGFALMGIVALIRVRAHVDEQVRLTDRPDRTREDARWAG